MPLLGWVASNDTPRIRRAGDLAYEWLWNGGVMQPARVAPFEVAYRLMDGSAQRYNTAGGAKLWAFTYTFENMPAPFYLNLLRYYDWNKGLPGVAPVALELLPAVQDFAKHGVRGGGGSAYTLTAQQLQASLYTVDMDMPELTAERRVTARRQVVGYTGSVRFVEAVPVA